MGKHRHQNNIKRSSSFILTLFHYQIKLEICWEQHVVCKMCSCSGSFRGNKINILLEVSSWSEVLSFDTLIWTVLAQELE